MSEVDADVAIFGAGAAGLTLASELDVRGVRSIVLNEDHCIITGVHDDDVGVRIDSLERGIFLRVRVRYAVACGAVSDCLRAGGRFRIGRRFTVGGASSADYDTGIDDAVNLGWKLAAVTQGWGGDKLLDTYEAERRPYARRIASYLRAMDDSESALAPPRCSEQGSKQYAEFGARWRAHLDRTRYIYQLKSGFRYQSDIVAPDDDALPDSGAPGSRAPHISIEDGNGTLSDHFGRDFTLLWLGIESPAANWHSVADALGIPLRIVSCAERRALTLYGADLVLIRPDGHITWRGSTTADARAVLRLATLK